MKFPQKNNPIYVIIILTLLLVIVITKNIKTNIKLKKLSKDYIEQKTVYDSLQNVSNKELATIELDLEDLNTKLRNSKSLVKSLEIQNRINNTQIDILEKEIVKYNTIRNENSKKIYTPEQLDNRLTTILNN